MSQIREACPQEILDWIAWYPDQGLTPAQRGGVEAHASQCAACREEIAVLAGHSEAPAAPADPERVFARVLALVESHGLATSAAPQAELRLAAPPLAAPVRRHVPGRSARGGSRYGVPRWAAAAALALLAAGLGWLAHDGWLRTDAGALYRTASDVAPATAGAGPALDVVFRSDASAEKINTALRGLGGAVVSGPTQLGRYRIELPPDADFTAAAALLRADGTGVASFAEPVRP